MSISVNWLFEALFRPFCYMILIVMTAPIGELGLPPGKRLGIQYYHIGNSKGVITEAPLTAETSSSMQSTLCIPDENHVYLHRFNPSARILELFLLYF